MLLSCWEILLSCYTHCVFSQFGHIKLSLWKTTGCNVVCDLSCLLHFCLLHACGISNSGFYRQNPYLNAFMEVKTVCDPYFTFIANSIVIFSEVSTSCYEKNASGQYSLFCSYLSFFYEWFSCDIRNSKPWATLQIHSKPHNFWKSIVAISSFWRLLSSLKWLQVFSVYTVPAIQCLCLLLLF